jgi:hypothetical protein
MLEEKTEEEIGHSIIEKIEDRDIRIDWKKLGIHVLKYDQHREGSHNENNINIQSKKSVRFSVDNSTINDNGEERELFQGFWTLNNGSITNLCCKMKFLE